ncbi:MAG: hypothetical protein WCG81_03725 [Candidatus Angelobacter sp.]
MSCVPESGGCERRFLDPFVGYLNETFGSAYVFRECLDVNDSTKPQPEALYEDPVQKRHLVIERKSISWPVDFPHRHGNDHFVANLFGEELKEHQFESGLYEIGLPLLIAGTQRELRSLVQAAAKKIKSAWPQIVAGAVLRERVNQNWWWSIRRVPDWDREDVEPGEGLKFSWKGPIVQLGKHLDPTDLPQELVLCLKKLFRGCVDKFLSYSASKRILLLAPHGDLEYKDAPWWKDVLLRHCPPNEIEEIWSARFDDEWEGWTFERLH